MGGCNPYDCTGLCCVSLILPMSPEELAQRDAPDAEQISGMLEPMSRSEAAERYEDFGDIPGPEFNDPTKYFYRCRNFDEETRRCRIYKERPSMCWRFPYGERCRHGCSVKGQPYEEGEDRL